MDDVMPYPEGPECFDRAVELLEFCQHAFNRIPNQPLTPHAGPAFYFDYKDTYSLVRDIEDFFRFYNIPG